MMRNFILFISISIGLCGFAQNEDANWVFGAGTLNHIQFQEDSTIVIDSIVSNPFHRFFRTNACISDTNGNLDIYFTGQKIFDSNGELIYNGDSINPGFIADGTFGFGYGVGNGALFLRDINNQELIRLFHVKADTVEFLPLNEGLSTVPLYRCCLCR